MSLGNNVLNAINQCRICLDAEYSSGINFVKHDNMLQLLEYCIGSIVNIQNTSHILCLKCVKKIEKFAKFKAKCIESEELWRTYTTVTVSKHNDNNIHENISAISVKEEQIQICEDFNEPYQSEENTGESIDEFNNSIGNEGRTEIKDDHKFLDYDRKLAIDLKNNDETVKVENEHGKIYHCKICNKIYNKYKWLLTHMAKGCCKRTKKKIKQQSNILDENCSTEDVKLSTNECGLCNLSFGCNINEHLNQHWSKNDLKCDLCSYIGRDFAHMITHRRIHYPKMKLECHACDRKKLSILSLQFHFRSVHLQKPGGYCTVCDRTFTKYKTWKRHHRLHTEKDLFICDYCGRKFLFRHEIKLHLIDHSDVRQFVCETCGKGFKRIFTLREHIDNIHKTRKPVKCGHCNKIYKCENKLKIHMRNVAKDKPFTCDVCSKKFYTENILKKHMFWHTNERPYSCEVCGSKYKAKGQLNVHMRNHTGIKPYKCVNCGKGFATGNQLKRHKSVHTGIRAYRCTHCERSFHERKSLLEHAVQHGNIENVKLET